MKSWPENKYIYRKGNDILDERGKKFCITNSKLFADWELVKEPAPNWDSVIKNKCLCWFWDDEFEMKKVGLLTSVDKDDEYPFEDDNDTGFMNCRPVRRDELTFYEGKKDVEKD